MSCATAVELVVRDDRADRLAARRVVFLDVGVQVQAALNRLQGVSSKSWRSASFETSSTSILTFLRKSCAIDQELQPAPCGFNLLERFVDA